MWSLAGPTLGNAILKELMISILMMSMHWLMWMRWFASFVRVLAIGLAGNAKA
jgi:hypothetical protein